MKPIQSTENPLVLRADFSNQAAWESIRATIRQPVGDHGFLAHVDYLEDPTFDGVDVAQLLGLTAGTYNHSFLILVDRVTITSPEYPLLVVDLSDEPGRTFRAGPSQVQGVQNNLSLGNMNFEDFAVAVDADGIFRDFPE